MEKDNQIKGKGNSLDFGARIYDSRLGRWLALDPLQAKYPGLSPYNFVSNNPIYSVDPDGRKIIPNHQFKQSKYKAAFDIVKNLKSLQTYISPFKEGGILIFILTMEE